MNYAALVQAVQDTVENSFSTTDIDLLIRQAEEKIYFDVQLPAVITEQTGTIAANTKYLGTITNFLYPISFAIVTDPNVPSVYDTFKYLLFKDYEFLREAYPNPNITGEPKYYAIFNDGQLMIAPTTNQLYNYAFRFGTLPISITVAGTSWLGNNAESVLLSATLMQAIRFLKGDKDQVELYANMYKESLAQIKNLADGQLRQDLYHTMQVKRPVV